MTSRGILLINPNSSQATSDMMLAIAGKTAGVRAAVTSATASRNPIMIVTERELDEAAAEVVEIGQARANGHDGIIVSAFGDPGLAGLRQKVGIPVVGICEASMIAASAGGRRFSVATVTPELVGPIADKAKELGLERLYCGTRLTEGDPIALANDAVRLEEALAEQVRLCIEEDGAEAVIIGGGPLGQAAERLQPRFDTPVIAPIPAAVERLIALLVDPAQQDRPG
jgi:allantoin racemase